MRESKALNSNRYLQSREYRQIFSNALNEIERKEKNKREKKNPFFFSGARKYPQREKLNELYYEFIHFNNV